MTSNSSGLVQPLATDAYPVVPEGKLEVSEEFVLKALAIAQNPALAAQLLG